MNIRQQLRNWHKNIPNLYSGSFRNKWIKALQRKSMKAAVVAKCQDCMNWQNAEVRECNVITCPLFQYRPFADKNGKLESDVIIAVTEIDRNERNNNVLVLADAAHRIDSGAQEGTLALCYEKNGL